MSSPPLTPWTARVLRRATKADALYGTCIVLLAVLSVWSGRAAAHRLSPAGASSASLLLDELDLPGALPNAPLTRDDGVTTRLHELTREPRTIVTFYAPWCGPCQEELPVLVRGTSQHPGRLAVVVGADEEAREVRRKLDNLGLKDVRYYVDADGQVHAGGRVTALPSTFLLGRAGRVLDRVVGNSEFRLQMLMYKAANDGATTFAHED
jgi:thiol-disulfide isomerase/thioredoxin